MINGELQGHKIKAKNMGDFRHQVDEIEKKLFAFPQHEETDITDSQWIKNCNSQLPSELKKG